MPALVLPRTYNAASHFVDRHLDEGRADKTAFIDADGEHTFAALAERVNRAARAFAEAGVRPEERVMIGLLDSIDFVAVFFGAMKLGAIPVPVNTLLTTDDYRYLLSDSRATTLVASWALWDRWGPASEGQAHLRRVFIRDDANEQPTLPSATTSLEATLARVDSSPMDVAATTPDDPAFWLYSSGSTGAPKGAIHLMGDLAQTAVLYGQGVLGIQSTDRVYSAAKLFFAYGLGNAMTFPLHVGATAILWPHRPTPDAVAEIFDKHRPTIFYGVPTLYAAMLAADRSWATDALRRCVSAGEALPEDLLERWRTQTGVEILDGLGSTEMLHIFLSNVPGSARAGSTGRPVSGYDVELRDENGLPVLDADALGELWVRGPTSATAYWNQRQRSLQTFHGPWTRTGDKYTRDTDGFYYYAGRSDDMMKVGGIWVSPFEVEAALAAHPDVLEAAVVGMDDDAGLLKPHAYVVLQPQASLRAEDAAVATLQQFVKQRLAPYKYPRWITFVDDLPKTATGKVQRFKLRTRHG